MALKVGDYLTLYATVRAVHAEWAELDITAQGTEPVAPIRVPLGFLMQREVPETGADMKELASKPSIGKARRTPNHDKA